MKERAAILFLCAGLLLCCAVGISMLFGCAGVALLVLGYLVQRDFPGLQAGERRSWPVPALHRDGGVPPSAAVTGQLRHVRILTIARPSTLIYDWQADE